MTALTSEELQEEARTLKRLQKMICTANKIAEKRGYKHGEIELGCIRRVMEATVLYSVPPGAERVIMAYYERMTGRKAYL